MKNPFLALIKLRPDGKQKQPNTVPRSLLFQRGVKAKPVIEKIASLDPPWIKRLRPLVSDIEAEELLTDFKTWAGEQTEQKQKRWKTEFDAWIDYLAAFV